MEEISKTKISRLPLASSFQEGDEVVFRRNTKAWRAEHSLLKGDRGEQGLDAFMTWKTETGNTSATFEEYALAIKGDKGDKGDPFVYTDFTSEQLADLRLTWDKLTAEQKAELKLRFSDLTEDDKNELKQPAIEAATEVRSDMNGIKTEWSGLKTDVEEATEAALDTANHPTYIGEDNYVYEWDGDEYVKTDVYVKGNSGAMVISDISEADNYPDTGIFLVPTAEPTDLDNWIQNW